MTILAQIRERILQPTTPSQPPVLRDGQIVQGEILKIHPNNRAEIQIGAHKMVAEITTSLSVGRKYFFQVQTTGQIVQLKVMGEHLKQESSQNILQLLNLFDIKATRANISFVQMLVNEKIPFNQEQLQQAVQLFEKNANKMEAMNIIKEMLFNRLPMTDNVFQALSSNQQTTISPLLHQLITELRQLPQLNEAQQKLLTLLENITTRTLPTELQLVQNIMNQQTNRGALLHVFQLAGLVAPNVEIASWNQRLEQLMPSNSQTNPPLEKILNNLIGIGRPNDGQVMSSLQQTATQLTNEASLIQSAARKIMGIFQHAIQSNSLSNEQFSTLRNMIIDQLLPHLPSATKEIFLPLLQQNRPENQMKILQLLQTFTNQETYQMTERLVVKEPSQPNPMIGNQSVQQQFLTHINHYLQSIGMADEHILKMQLANIIEQGNLLENRQADTVKSLLIQMIQQDHVTSSERIQQLIHFINGMQLQSVQESNNFIHATLQIPGEKLALNRDMYMQFEGKKTKDGKIDPDFCRILFVLHLQNIEETIIDMHVQKRIISITIFNDSDDLTHNITGLKNMLRENLSKLDYHLSAISWKPLHEQKEEEIVSRSAEQSTKHEQKERFDFLI